MLSYYIYDDIHWVNEGYRQVKLLPVFCWVQGLVLYCGGLFITDNEVSNYSNALLDFVRFCVVESAGTVDLF